MNATRQRIAPATAEQLPYRMHRAASKLQRLHQELLELCDDCWADENTVRLSPALSDLRELIDSAALLQEPLNQLSAATDLDR